jgi:hypothetical protein
VEIGRRKSETLLSAHARLSHSSLGTKFAVQIKCFSPEKQQLQLQVPPENGLRLQFLLAEREAEADLIPPSMSM